MAGRESIKTALWGVWMDWRQGFWPKRAFCKPRIHRIGFIRRLSGLAATARGTAAYGRTRQGTVAYGRAQLRAGDVSR